jgi:hypothetical protein
MPRLPMNDPQAEEHPDVVDGEITITTVFRWGRGRKSRPRNGERLEISSLRVPHTVRLDALVLESLTWREFSDLAKGLETPFGPGANERSGEAPA